MCCPHGSFFLILYSDPSSLTSPTTASPPPTCATSQSATPVLPQHFSHFLYCFNIALRSSTCNRVLAFVRGSLVRRAVTDPHSPDCLLYLNRPPIESLSTFLSARSVACSCTTQPTSLSHSLLFKLQLLSLPTVSVPELSHGSSGRSKLT